MSNSDQNDIDSMFGELENSSKNTDIQPSELAENSDISTPESTTIQSTGVLTSIQGKHVSDGKSFNEQKIQQGLVPWVDFLPADERPKANNLIEYLERAIENGEASLYETEELKLEYVFGNEIESDYFERWVQDSNMYFRHLAALKRRLRDAKAKLSKEA